MTDDTTWHTCPAGPGPCTNQPCPLDDAITDEPSRPRRSERTFTNQDVADWVIMLTLALLLLVIGAAYTGVIGR